MTIQPTEPLGAAMVEPSISVQIAQCPICGGPLRIFTGEHVAWEKCAICNESNLLGWSSCQIGVLELSPALEHRRSYASPPTTQ